MKQYVLIKTEAAQGFLTKRWIVSRTLWLISRHAASSQLKQRSEEALSYNMTEPFNVSFSASKDIHSSCFILDLCTDLRSVCCGNTSTATSGL